MKLTIVAAAVACVAAASEKLKIGVLSKPAECARRAKPGDTVGVHYAGSLEDGHEFDNSYRRGSPITFTLGAKQVIPGWDQGLLGMCLGEKRKLTIPSELGYGEYGAGEIPPFATLIFVTELVAINGQAYEPAAPAADADADADADTDADAREL